jgi:CheY-like chemotaxis protein
LKGSARKIMPIPENMEGQVWARNGKQAVEIHTSHDDIDLILMDIRMPVMNGLQATKVIS